VRRIDATHDPSLRSWVNSANEPGTDFPIQNLPFGVFRRAGTQESFRGGVAIGSVVLDLAAVNRMAILPPEAATALAAAAQPSLNVFMSMGPSAAGALRSALSNALRAGSPLESRLQAALIPQSQAQFALPATIGDYTDFYASIHHATAVGRLFRPDNPLLPNYKWVPIGYHGRSSSIAVSGQGFHRPAGQTLPAGARIPSFGPSRRLDYELEMGAFVGRGNSLGEPIPLDEAESHLFGVCLLNDWSARDLQSWEYQPLGPFLAKNFATTISPWIVTLEALAPFRASWMRPADDPQPLAYLDSREVRAAGAVDVELEAYLETQRVREQHLEPHQLSQSNLRDLYWSLSQLVTHHSVNGCNLQPGDLVGTGTLSGPAPRQAGSLLELSQNGKSELHLPSGETRTFLEDGDRVIFRAGCTRAGYARIGFGEVSGTVLPARMPAPTH
jgi:fumarylacetoacetase